MSAIIALLPVRNRVDGKRRLATVFTPSERRTLIESMAQHVVATLLDSGAVSRVMVISQDPDFVDDVLPESDGVALIHQLGRGSGLNAALELGREWALVRGASRLLVVFGDLPLLDVDDIHDLVSRTAPVVLATDNAGVGTNALLLDGERAPEADLIAGFGFRFGHGSLGRHLAEASKIGVSADIAMRQGTGHDLDTPEDWTALHPDVRRRLLPTDPRVERSAHGRRLPGLSLSAAERT